MSPAAFADAIRPSSEESRLCAALAGIQRQARAVTKYHGVPPQSTIRKVD